MRSQIDFRLQARTHDGCSAGARCGYFGLRVHVHEDQEVGSAGHDGGVLVGRLVSGGTYFDFVFAALNIREGGGSAVLRGSGQVYPAEIGGKLHKGVAGQGHAPDFPDAHDHGDGSVGQGRTAAQGRLLCQGASGNRQEPRREKERQQNAADGMIDGINLRCHGNTRGAKTASGEKITGGGDHGQVCDCKLLVSALGVRRTNTRSQRGAARNFP